MQRRGASALLVVFLLSACSSPAHRADRLAERYGFEKHMVAGDPHRHVTYQRFSGIPGSELHVYIEGDGLPWSSRHKVSVDPTPRKPEMLDLMSMDNHPSIYLGRPCYFGMSSTPPCHPFHWTHGRYSEQVVDSMQQALQAIISSNKYNGVVFFGHSGGGTLAMLLAPRFPSTRAVVTIAGNLDPDSWTALHGYSPLCGSLNPSNQSPLPQSIAQYHFAGANDTDVPPFLIEQAAARQPNMQFIQIPGFDHACCWQQIWEEILGCVDKLCSYPAH